MICLECHQEFSYANAADWAVLHHTGCCSTDCAILKNLSLIFGLNRSALLPLLVYEGTSSTQVMFRLEDILKDLQQALPPVSQT
jgi:hypothetical protein